MDAPGATLTPTDILKDHVQFTQRIPQAVFFTTGENVFIYENAVDARVFLQVRTSDNQIVIPEPLVTPPIGAHFTSDVAAFADGRFVGVVKSQTENNEEIFATIGELDRSGAGVTLSLSAPILVSDPNDGRDAAGNPTVVGVAGGAFFLSASMKASLARMISV